jgi:hypothetical protein
MSTDAALRARLAPTADPAADVSTFVCCDSGLEHGLATSMCAMQA